MEYQAANAWSRQGGSLSLLLGLEGPGQSAPFAALNEDQHDQEHGREEQHKTQ